MTPDEFRSYCLAKPLTSASTPFGPEVLVFKVADKMFATLGASEGKPAVNLKAPPEMSVALREEHAAITPGYHMNKRHWNTITLDGRVPPELLRHLIDLSYGLVARSLKKADREALGL
ncbi:MAG TPA: MmcQ/YjbR family DNA-binding protein [Oscillatoriaceae cyanobacterium]